MSLSNYTTGVPQRVTNNCDSSCTTGVCADFTIKRHDTKPDFRVLVEDCDGPLDLTDDLLVLEANMWVNARLRTAIGVEDNAINLADNIGFDQVMVNDIIMMQRARNPEFMLVTGFIEEDNLIIVQRGYHGSLVSEWKKGTYLKIFRMLNAPATIESKFEDVENVDGVVTPDVLQETYLVYEWAPNDTCLPGCFMLEFKLMKMTAIELVYNKNVIVPSISIPSISVSVDDCTIGSGVEWARRFPASKEGFMIQILDSPTSEIV